MADNARSIDLGPPADPKGLWPVVDVDALPVAWRVVERGQLQEVRVLGRTAEVVFAVVENVQAPSRAERPPWYRIDSRTLDPAEVYTDKRDAAVAALVRLRRWVLRAAEDMKRLVVAAGVKLEDDEEFDDV